MSDRMRGSVRTGARDDDGAAGGGPEIVTPDRGATAFGVGGPAPAAAASDPGRSAQTAVRSPEVSPERAEGPAPEPTPTPGPASSAEGTQAITPDSPPSGVFAVAAQPAAPVAPTAEPAAPTAEPAAGGAAGSAPPVSPLVPPPGAPPVQKTGVGRAAGGRNEKAAAPVAPRVGIDATQAVTLPPAGSRQAGAPGQDRAPAASSPAPASSPISAASPASSTAAPKGQARGLGRGPRRARLQLRHIDTWSALKMSLVLSVALFCVWMVAVGILYGVLSGLGVFDTLNSLIGQLSTSVGNESADGVISAGIVFWGAAVIGAVNIVLLTALCTIGAFIYNLVSDMVGGLELTLAERE